MQWTGGRGCKAPYVMSRKMRRTGLRHQAMPING
jgi:hypothetical protein